MMQSAFKNILLRFLTLNLWLFGSKIWYHHLSFPIHFTLKTLESIKKQIKNESALPRQHSSPLLYVVDCLSNFCSKISHSHKKFLLKTEGNAPPGHITTTAIAPISPNIVPPSCVQNTLRFCRIPGLTVAI